MLIVQWIPRSLIQLSPSRKAVSRFLQTVVTFLTGTNWQKQWPGSLESYWKQYETKHKTTFQPFMDINYIICVLDKKCSCVSICKQGVKLIQRTLLRSRDVRETRQDLQFKKKKKTLRESLLPSLKYPRKLDQCLQLFLLRILHWKLQL